MQILCYPNDGLSQLYLDKCLVIAVVGSDENWPELPVNNGALKLRFKKGTDYLDEYQIFAIKDYYVKKRQLGHRTLVIGTSKPGIKEALLILLEKL